MRLNREEYLGIQVFEKNLKLAKMDVIYGQRRSIQSLKVLPERTNDLKYMVRLNDKASIEIQAPIEENHET